MKVPLQPSASGRVNGRPVNTNVYVTARASARANHRASSRHQAAEPGVFGLHTVYQPIMDLETNTPSGWEGLSRFRSGHTAESAMAMFTGTPAEIQLDWAMAAGVIRRSIGLPDGFVSVNLSARAATDIEHVRMLLQTDRKVVLEITERDEVNFEDLVTTVHALRGTCEVAIDDLGVGYSSLVRMAELQPEIIKIPRPLVKDLGNDGYAESLVGAIAEFATKVGSRVIAEGIETPEQLAVVKDLGIPLGQGYLLGRPAPAPGFTPPLPEGLPG